MDVREFSASRERLQGVPRALCFALVLVLAVILVGAVCGCATGHRECAVSKPWRHSSSRRRGLPYFRPPSHYLASQIARPFRHTAEVVQEAPTSHVVPLYDSPWWPGMKWRRDELYNVLFPENASWAAPGAGQTK